MLQPQTARTRENNRIGSEIHKPPSCSVDSQSGEQSLFKFAGEGIAASNKIRHRIHLRNLDLSEKGACSQSTSLHPEIRLRKSKEAESFWRGNDDSILRGLEIPSGSPNSI